jgi:hypothetical protein
MMQLADVVDVDDVKVFNMPKEILDAEMSAES